MYYTCQQVREVENILTSHGFTKAQPYKEFGKNASQPYQSSKYTVFMRRLGMLKREIQMRVYDTKLYNSHQGGFLTSLNVETEDYSWILPEEED